MIFKWWRKSISAYVDFERSLAELQCVIVDSGGKIEKFIRTFPKKQRLIAVKLAHNLALMGDNVDEIIKILTMYRKALA